MRTIRVLLVDDSLPFLAVARELIAVPSEIEIVGAVLSGAEAIEQVIELSPDVVVMDLFMPTMNGLEAARWIKALAHPPRIVMISMEDDAGFRTAASEHGADGFVAKAALPIELPPLLRQWFS